MDRITSVAHQQYCAEIYIYSEKGIGSEVPKVESGNKGYTRNGRRVWTE